MVRVYGDTTTGPFLIDRCEVTNKQYREFMRAGGYADTSYWKEAFIENGRRIPWSDAMKRFVDATGRPGPATWRAGDYPEGEDDYPVAGVSWYEAAAYARFAGKKLPSIVHWYAAQDWYWFYTYNLNRYLIPASNFSDRAVRAVGTGEFFGPNGIRDLAGNVREWCWNETVKGRCLRGGAWNDATYMYESVTQSPPFDRSPKNGIRCMTFVEGSLMRSDAFDPVYPTEEYDLRQVKQISDDVYRIYRDRFEYEKVPLRARTEFRHESSGDWITERVSFDDFVAGGRMSAFLFLPRNAVPPFQTVVYFPGSWAAVPATMRSDSLGNYPVSHRTFRSLIRSGRALVFPIALGMFEREIPKYSSNRGWADYRVRVVQEYRRILDYLESRSDIDSARIGYWGHSWGGGYANLILAVESRYRAAILQVGYLELEPQARPEVRMLYFTPRILTPVLMLNGLYDMACPLERDVRPMLEMLGTPAQHKRLVVYPTDHFIPPDEFLRESLAWLDRYLGPVRFK
jgi:dienelactone hydrolase